MTVSIDSTLFSDLVVRLRTAGCVFAEDEAALLVEAAATPAAVELLADRRVAGQPLEHVLGWVDFRGLRIVVDPGVFVPRRRTELMVTQASALGAGRGAVVVDLGCGSGALGVALAAELGSIELYAADLDPAAARCARCNVAAVGGTVYEGDLFEPLPPELRGRVDVLLANMPYVPSEKIALMPPEARLHEATVALDGGTDGLDVIRRVAHAAPRWLAPHGSVLVEVSERQVGRAMDEFTGSGLRARVATDEEVGGAVVIGTLP